MWRRGSGDLCVESHGRIPSGLVAPDREFFDSCSREITVWAAGLLPDSLHVGRHRGFPEAMGFVRSEGR